MNHATKVNVTILGIVFAISGINHGLFEALQGNIPTNSLIIYAISDTVKRWPHGGEAAFTLLPNFLFAGIATISVSLAIILWTVRFIHTKHGTTIFLLLFILLFLVGGGIGQIPFFLMIWAFATRINKPMSWWRKVLSGNIRNSLARLWPWTLVVSALLILFALEIAIFGYVPGVTDSEQLLSIVFASLGAGLIFIVLSFVSGFACDIQPQGDLQFQSPANIKGTV